MGSYSVLRYRPPAKLVKRIPVALPWQGTVLATASLHKRERISEIDWMLPKHADATCRPFFSSRNACYYYIARQEWVNRCVQQYAKKLISLPMNQILLLLSTSQGIAMPLFKNDRRRLLECGEQVEFLTILSWIFPSLFQKVLEWSLHFHWKGRLSHSSSMLESLPWNINAVYYLPVSRIVVGFIFLDAVIDHCWHHNRPSKKIIIVTLCMSR